MDYIKKRSILLFFYLISASVFAQNVIIPEGNSYQNIKASDIPVNNYSGRVNINVPLYSIKGKSLIDEIVLNYHASGIKVDELASWVGLGWSLNVGGSITRIVRGLPDESPKGYAHTNGAGKMAKRYYNFMKNGVADLSDINTTNLGLMIMGPSTSPGIVFSVYKNMLDKNEIDGEPDLFYLNIPKYSCVFVFDEQGYPMVMPNSNIEIFSPIGAEEEPFWTVRDIEGNIYTFGTSSISQEVSQQVVSGDEEPTSYGEEFISTWYLTETNSPNGDVIYYKYKMESPYSVSYLSQVKYDYLNTDAHSPYLDPPDQYNIYWPYGDPGLGTTGEINSITTENKIKRSLVLDEILFAQGKIKFRTIERNDLVGGKALDKIEIYNLDLKMVKGFQFQYTYFNAGCSGIECYRLSLKSIFEIGNNSSQVVNQFEYNTTENLPARNSFMKDFWGYYNSNTANHLIPEGTFDGVFYAGANRNPDEQKVQANILKKIIYPGGGYKLFEYESHRYYDDAAGAELLGPGIRIKSIFVFDGTTLTKMKSYTYHNGNIMNNPWFMYKKKIVDGALNWGRKEFKFLLRFSNSLRELGTTQGSPVGYASVEESTKDLGKVVYYYSNLQSVPDSFIQQSNLTTYYIDHSANLNYTDGPHINMDYLRGYIQQQDIYNENNQLVKRIRNSYTRSLPLNSLDETYALRVKRKDLIYYTPGYKAWYEAAWGSLPVEYNIYFFKHNTRDLLLTEVRTEDYYYDDQNNPQIHYTTEKFEYNRKYHILTKKIVNGPDNRDKVTLYSYPIDYSVPNMQFTNDLKVKRILKPVEVVTYIETKAGKQVVYGTADKEVVDGNLNFYDSNGNLKEIYSLEISNPVSIPNSGFKFSTKQENNVIPPQGTNASVFSWDIRYKRKIRYESLDAIGNVNQSRNEYALANSTIWGYENEYYTPNNVNRKTGELYPIGEALKASRNQIAHTSFEGKYDKDWNYSSFNKKTSDNVSLEKYYSGSIEVPTLTITDNYKLGFYARGTGNIYINGTVQFVLSSPNSWKYLEYSFTGLTYLKLNAPNEVYIDMVKLEKNIAGVFNQVAYTDFETSTSGGWSYDNTKVKSFSIIPKTGNVYYSGEVVLISPLSPVKLASGDMGKYKLSFWAIGTGKIEIWHNATGTNKSIIENQSDMTWKYYEVFLDNTQAQYVKINSIIKEPSGDFSRVYIDEIRIHPEEASMITRTYLPLIGVTSETNEKNITTYYEYDDLGRLKLVRDHNRNIIKRNTYKFKN